MLLNPSRVYLLVLDSLKSNKFSSIACLHNLQHSVTRQQYSEQIHFEHSQQWTDNRNQYWRSQTRNIHCPASVSQLAVGTTQGEQKCSHDVSDKTKKPTVQQNNSDAKPFDSIPGPLRLPIIGTLLPYKLGFKSIHYYHEHLREMYDMYGPIVREVQGSTTIIHVFDPEDMRTVYRSTTVPHVAPLLQTAADYKQSNNLNLGIGNTNGPEWEMLRKAVNKFTLKPQSANKYIPKQDRVAVKAVGLLQQLVQEDGSVPRLEELIDRWITESLSLVVAGAAGGHLELQGGLLSENNSAKILAQESRSIFELSTHLKLSTGFYQRFATPKARKLKKVEDSFYRSLKITCNKLLQEKDSALAAGRERRGPLDELGVDCRLPSETWSSESGPTSATQPVHDEGDDCSVLYQLIKDQQLSRPDLITVTMSLLTDGYSTTAPTLLGAMHCLAMSPKVQEELHQEILQLLETDDGSTDSVVLSSDLLARALKLSAFVKEVLRLYPIGDGVQRLLTHDMVLSGYHLPEGTRLDLNPIIWLRDPAIFPEPETVMLERWSRPPAAGALTDNFHPIINTPFSTGVRTCVGRRLAEHDLNCFILRLLQRYTLSMASPKAPRQVYRVLLRPETPIPLRFHRR